MNTIVKSVLATSALMFAIAASAQVTPASSTDTSTGAMQASAAVAKPTRSTGRYIDDKTISAKINAEFLADTDITSRDIKVSTYKGVVHLRGTVPSQDQADAAVSKARAITGVKAVKSSLTVAATN